MRWAIIGVALVRVGLVFIWTSSRRVIRCTHSGWYAIEPSPSSLASLFLLSHAAGTRRWINVGLTLVHSRRRWTNVKPTLIQRLVSVGWLRTFKRMASITVDGICRFKFQLLSKFQIARSEGQIIGSMGGGGWGCLHRLHLGIKECIYHFTKWQIPLFITKVTVCSERSSIYNRSVWWTSAGYLGPFKIVCWRNLIYWAEKKLAPPTRRVFAFQRAKWKGGICLIFM